MFVHDFRYRQETEYSGQVRYQEFPKCFRVVSFLPECNKGISVNHFFIHSNLLILYFFLFYLTEFRIHNSNAYR